MSFTVSIQTQDFDVSQELAALRAGDARVGAVCSFLGTVRERNDGSSVASMELEHYPGMTEKTLLQIAQEGAKRWSLQAARIVHRVGKMYPGDQIVLVLTASAHRQDAYEANAFMMDFLKTEAPFWKKEWTPDGPRWIEARETDAQSAQRWQTPNVK